MAALGAAVGSFAVPAAVQARENGMNDKDVKLQGKAEEVVDKAEKDKALKMEAEAVMKKAKEEVEAMKMEVEEAKKKAEQEVATLSGWSGLVLMAGVIVRAFM